MAKSPKTNTYNVRKSYLQPNPDLDRWDLFKLDDEGEHVETYNVFEEYTRKTNDSGQSLKRFICTCPSYKSPCKHITWINSLRMNMRRDPTITGGTFNPATAQWQFTHKAEDDHDS